MCNEVRNELMAMLLEKVRRVCRVSSKEHASAARSANYHESVIQESLWVALGCFGTLQNASERYMERCAAVQSAAERSRAI